MSKIKGWLSIAGIVLVAVLLVSITVAQSYFSYRECRNYFSFGYCIFNPTDWPKQKGVK